MDLSEAKDMVGQEPRARGTSTKTSDNVRTLTDLMFWLRGMDWLETHNGAFHLAAEYIDEYVQERGDLILWDLKLFGAAAVYMALVTLEGRKAPSKRLVLRRLGCDVPVSRLTNVCMILTDDDEEDLRDEAEEHAGAKLGDYVLTIGSIYLMYCKRAYIGGASITKNLFRIGRFFCDLAAVRIGTAPAPAVQTAGAALLAALLVHKANGKPASELWTPEVQKATGLSLDKVKKRAEFLIHAAHTTTRTRDWQFYDLVSKNVARYVEQPPVVQKTSPNLSLPLKKRKGRLILVLDKRTRKTSPELPKPLERNRVARTCSNCGRTFANPTNFKNHFWCHKVEIM